MRDPIIKMFPALEHANFIHPEAWYSWFLGGSTRNGNERVWIGYERAGGISTTLQDAHDLAYSVIGITATLTRMDGSNNYGMVASCPMSLGYHLNMFVDNLKKLDCIIVDTTGVIWPEASMNLHHMYEPKNLPAIQRIKYAEYIKDIFDKRRETEAAAAPGTGSITLPLKATYPGGFCNFNYNDVLPDRPDISALLQEQWMARLLK